MPLISLLRSLSFRRLPALDGPDSSSDPSQRSTSRRSKREQSRERRASVLQECLTRSIDPILLPLPEGGETHRRAERRVRARHISFDATTEAHQRYKSLGFPRIPTYSVELERREYVPYPAHWSRSYHAMYEGAEGPIIQDAMYMSLLHVLVPEHQSATAYAPPEAPMLPSVESFATIKHHAINDDFSLETFTPSPSPPSTPKSVRRTAHAQAATPRAGQPLFLPSPYVDSPHPSPVRSVQETPTRKTPTFKRLAESASMQAVFGMSLSVSTSFDSTANFALGLVVASESGGSKGWESIQELNGGVAERRRTQTAAF